MLNTNEPIERKERMVVGTTNTESRPNENKEEMHKHLMKKR